MVNVLLVSGVVWSVHYDNGHRVTICIDTLVNNIWLSHPYITSGQDPWSYVSGQERHITHSVLFIKVTEFKIMVCHRLFIF